jgi:hypothetical protein
MGLGMWGLKRERMVCALSPSDVRSVTTGRNIAVVILNDEQHHNFHKWQCKKNTSLWDEFWTY